MKIEMQDMGIRWRKGIQVYKTKFIIDGKVHYSEVDRAFVDRFGEMFRQREDKKVLIKWKTAEAETAAG